MDAAKRELGLLAAAVVYALLGPDRWAWPKTQPVLDSSSLRRR